MNSMVNLKKAISLITETVVSDGFELSVANSINKKFKGTGITAIRPPADTSLPDVLVKVKDVGESFIEVKMSHTDNLANARVFFDGTTWKTTYKTPAAAHALRLLNENDDAKEFVEDIKTFTKKKNVKLPTTIGGLKDPDAVSYTDMLRFVTARGSRYITKNDDINVGRLATLHYTVGKREPAHYLQAGNDFYLIGNADPLDLSSLNGGNVPRLAGKGTFHVRVSMRKSNSWYEIQIEMKIKKFNPATSPFSVLDTSSKINPFDALADSISSVKKSKPKTKKT